MTGVLVAGGPNFKIYSSSELKNWILCLGKRFIPIEDTSDTDIVNNYVNLKYQNQDDQSIIVQEMRELVEEYKTWDHIIIEDWTGRVLYEGHCDNPSFDRIIEINRDPETGDCPDIAIFWKNKKRTENVYEHINY